jgi:hypothetical protein
MGLFYPIAGSFTYERAEGYIHITSHKPMILRLQTNHWRTSQPQPPVKEQDTCYVEHATTTAATAAADTEAPRSDNGRLRLRDHRRRGVCGRDVEDGCAAETSSSETCGGDRGRQD